MSRYDYRSAATASKQGANYSQAMPTSLEAVQISVYMDERQAMRERQQRWLRERAIDQEKEQLSSALTPAQLVNTLTDKIATRMQSVLKPQERIEQTVADEKDTNTCSICFELMLPKERSPTLLFPCGHTFCKICLDSNAKKSGKKVCPWCRTRIESQAVNISLQNVIVAYAKNNGLYRETDAAPVPPAAPKPETSYSQQLELVTLRCSILQEEIQDNLFRDKEVEERLRSQEEVSRVLEQEKTDAEAKLRRAQQELRLVEDHLGNSRNALEELYREREELGVSLKLIRDTLAPLMKEREKLQTLARLQGND